MKKIIIFIIIVIFLTLGYWFISPLFTEKVVNEAVPVVSNNDQDINIKKDITNTPIIPQMQTVSSGSFSGFDRLHNGSGTAKVITIDSKHFIRFEEDFVVTNGPDLYVGLGVNGQYLKGSELGRLKGNKGSQNYELPIGMNSEDIKEVWVWCKAFSVPFARVVLQ